MHLRVLAINVWNIAGDSRRTDLLNRELQRIAPDLVAFEMRAIIRQPHHRRRIDYVFVGSWYAHPNAHCHIDSAKIAFDQPIDGVWASDHYGVLVDLDVGMDSAP